MIQKPNLKFKTSATIVMKNTSPNSLFSNQKSALKIGHHIGSKQGSILITHYFAKQPLTEKTAKQPLRALKLNQTAPRMENKPK